MAIINNLNNTTAIELIHNGILRSISAVYVGAKLVWKLITSLSSCFGNGYWHRDEPYDDSAWRE